MVDVDELISHPFGMRTQEEKERIVKQGKPQPALPNLFLIHKERTREYTRHFCISTYNSSEWLTGCEKRNKLFCWPCLLFSGENTAWSKKGFEDLRTLSKAMKRHEQTQTHIQHHMSLKLFGRQHQADELTSKQLMMENKAHNEIVKKNLKVMKSLIDTVCYLACQELPFRGRDESCDSLNRGYYLECLDFIRMYDPSLDEHLKKATGFRGTSPSIQNGLTNAISTVINKCIRDEISDSSFVSIMLDENSDISNESQLSTVIRYVRNGEACERFVGFSDVSFNRSASFLFDHVANIVSEYQIEDKLIGQACDGAVLMSGYPDGLQRKILENFPRALFVHCHAHVLNLVLQQSLSCVGKCRVFFKTLNGLSSFFSKSPKRRQALLEFEDHKPLNISATRWCFTSRLVNTVNDELHILQRFFVHVAQDSDGMWEDDSIVKARGFATFLDDFQTILYLEMFARIFSTTGVLDDILKANPCDIPFCSNQIAEVKEQLQKDRESYFDCIWNTAMMNYAAESSSAKKIKLESDDKYAWLPLYFEITDHVCDQIDVRYQSFNKLEFINLLYHPRYPDYRENFPDSILSNMQQTYGSIFDLSRLKNELNVIYSSQDFRDKSISQLIRFMVQNDLKTVFPQSYKLAELILAVPSTPASENERSLSALNRIRSYVQSSHSRDQQMNLSTISIERDVFARLRECGSLYDKVLHEFRQKNPITELEYK